MDRLEEYKAVFAEDIAGLNNRSQKTIWLTEVAAASANGTEVVRFIQELLDPHTGKRRV